ncbi:MAG: sigma-70 family RNA polymerase sigma factor [Phycisphaerales bacterium]|nr:MAG: sigma-70 family RNA polymerase sigma factor [Phycisphaerales bacterium]
MAPLTRVLERASAGDRQAAAELFPLVYDELRKLARSRMANQPPGATLQPTALVHEAYLKLVGGGDPGWDSRAHFFGAAAQAMRHILVDQARRKASLKRGGDRKRVDGDAIELTIEPIGEDILALDEALTELEQQDERKTRIVMLHYFGGLTFEETAAALGISVPTVQREWRFTRSWLFARLGGEIDGQS